MRSRKYKSLGGRCVRYTSSAEKHSAQTEEQWAHWFRPSHPLLAVSGHADLDFICTHNIRLRHTQHPSLPKKQKQQYIDPCYCTLSYISSLEFCMTCFVWIAQHIILKYTHQFTEKKCRGEIWWYSGPTPVTPTTPIARFLNSFFSLDVHLQHGWQAQPSSHPPPLLNATAEKRSALAQRLARFPPVRRPCVPIPLRGRYFFKNIYLGSQVDPF